MPNISRSSEKSEGELAAVSDAARMPRMSLTMAWWAVCSGMFYIVVGATLAMSYGARNAIIGMALSVVTYSVVNGMVSLYAMKTGLSVALFSKILFGRIGAALATLILFVAAIYYAMFEGSVIASAAQYMFTSLSYKWAALIVVAYSVPLVFGSVQRWLDKFNGFLLPFYLLGLFAAVYESTVQFGYNANWLSFGPQGALPAYGWWACFVYYMGVWGLMMFTFDFARFGRQRDASFHARFTFGVPFYVVTFLLNGSAGIYLVSAIPHVGALTEMSVVQALLKLMGFWGLAFVWVTQSRINTANYYLAVVNMQAFIWRVASARLPKYGCAVLVGVVVYLLMIGNVASEIFVALAYQGVFIVAWVGVAIAHIVSRKYEELLDGEYELRDTHVPPFNPGGLIAWFVGVAVGLAVMHIASWQSFSAPASFVASWLAYSVLLLWAKPTWFVRSGLGA